MCEKRNKGGKPREEAVVSVFSEFCSKNTEQIYFKQQILLNAYHVPE